MLKSFFLAALNLAFAPAATSAPQLINCAGNWGKTVESLEPQPVGPMTLSTIRCLSIPHRGYPVSLSPDGSKVFSFHALEGLWVGDLSQADENYTFPGRILPATFGESVPYEWLADSSEVIGVKRISRDDGFVVGALQPYLFTNTGSQSPLPALSHPSGPLDELFWIGGAGLALAIFGTKGEYYRPTHEDPNPTMSIVDAKAGQILDVVETAAIRGLPSHRRFAGVASRLDKKSGRARVLTTWGPDTWMLWDQGDSPRIIPIHNRTARTSYTLSMDGNKVLIMGNLSATGWICEFNNPRGCPKKM
jgi:hypothetical protein